MSNFRDHPSTAETNSTNRVFEVPNTFKRRVIENWRLQCPRRYVIALMLFLLPLIETWRNLNITRTLIGEIVSEEAQAEHSSIAHWTLKELDKYAIAVSVIDAIAQIPGALLIFISSSHKYLLASVSAISILHMLIPVALSHHSFSLLVVLITQCILAAPINTAVLTMWKDWAPPAERTKLMIVSVYGMLTRAAFPILYPMLSYYITKDACYYFSGIVGIVWALFWYNIISETPQNDPLISEKELLYLEGNIPSDIQKVKLKDVPWKSIITSKQVLLLGLIFFKMAISFGAMTFFLSTPNRNADEKMTNYYFIPFLASFAVILPCSAVLADYLIKKFSGRTQLIRKSFLCGGFLLQCIFIFVTLVKSHFTEAIFFIISYCMLAISLPGVITNALYLSSRYVSIIAGILFTFSALGTRFVSYVFAATEHLDSVPWYLLLDGGFSITAALLFAIWGDIQEQPWSLTFPSSPRNQDFRSFPKPEDEDDLNLATENA